MGQQVVVSAANRDVILPATPAVAVRCAHHDLWILALSPCGAGYWHTFR